MKRSLALSLAVHAIFYALFHLPTHKQALPSAPKVEIVLKEIASNLKAEKSSRSPKRSRRRAAKSFGAKFGPGILNAHLQGGMPGGGTILTDDGGTGPLEEDWGSRGGRLNEIEQFNKYEKLFAHLRGMVTYPSRLGDHAVSDYINSRITFDEHSHCDWSRSRVGGSHPYFRVYALALLKKLCAMETIEKIGFTNGQFVDISFTFEILNTPELNPRKDYVQGNVLSIRRTFLNPQYVVHAGPFQWSPIAPSMIYLDFPWIFEHWEKWVEGKDPLAEFK